MGPDGDNSSHRGMRLVKAQNDLARAARMGR